MILKAERPFTPNTKWGGWISYTLSWAEQNGGDDIFSLDRAQVNNYPRHPTPFDQRSVLSANGVIRLPLAELSLHLQECPGRAT